MAESFSTFEELVESRRKFLEGIKDDRTIADGIMRLLTDLYPDTAHFVYELLQNAEDVGATQVRFRLSEAGLYFAHNGVRDFSLEDIRAITGIGSNLGKKEDSTSIGEFGVGFKAVFAYTDTPEIHSGQFHFKIVDKFMPTCDGVSQHFIETTQSGGWTEFVFPFDRVEKPAKTAYLETKKGLEKLDETALLFLNHIESIEYEIQGKSVSQGFVKRIDRGNNKAELVVEAPGRKAPHVVSFLRYSKNETIKSDRGKIKTLPISIAYQLGKNEEGDEEVIALDEGKAFIYFPAEKETTNLRFHVNGPFSATVARDGLRDCGENNLLMRKIAQLVVDSLRDIKRQGLMSMSFYAVMPNNDDYLTGLYSPIRDAVLEAYWNNDYLVAARDGGYVRGEKAITGDRVFSDVITNDLLKAFAGINKRWIRNPLRNQAKREEAFLRSLNIARFEEVNFAEAFCEDLGREQLLKYAERAKIPWMKAFYVLLTAVVRKYTSHDVSPFAVRSQRSEHQILRDCFDQLKVSPIVKSLDGSFYAPSEIYIMPKGYKSDQINAPLVDPIFIDSAHKTQNYNTDAICMTLKNLGVREYSIEVELRRIAEKYRKSVNIKSEAYYKDLQTIVTAYKHGEKFDIGDIALFVARDQDGKLKIMRAENIFIGDAFGNPVGDRLAAFCGMPLLCSDIYKRVWSQEQCSDFVDYLVHCGAKTKLRIVETNVESNPGYQKVADKSRETVRCDSGDYIIPGMAEGLKHIDEDVAYSIWQLLVDNGATDRYALAYYQPNARANMERFPSMLILQLRNAEWIPDVLGNLHKPGQIKAQEMDRRFQSSARGHLIAALEIGSEFSKQKQAERRLEEEAKRQGMHLIGEDDYELLQQVKEQKRKAQEKAARKEQPDSVQELFDGQTRKGSKKRAVPSFADPGSVSNPERRAANIEATFKEKMAMPVKKRARYSMVYQASSEERDTLGVWYAGECQICGSYVIKANGEPYFEAINIINTNDLSDAQKATLGMCWNSLALCPNCAAKYKYSAKDISSMPEQIAHEEIMIGDDTRIKVGIELAGRSVAIHFSPKHFLAMRQGLKVLDEALETGE